MSAPIPFMYQGENRRVILPLLQEDGSTALLVSALQHAEIRLYQGGTHVVTYVKGTDAQLRAGDNTDELLLEITSTLTISLTAGLPLTALLFLETDDTGFEADEDLFKDAQKFTLIEEILAA